VALAPRPLREGLLGGLPTTCLTQSPTDLRKRLPRSLVTPASGRSRCSAQPWRGCPESCSRAKRSRAVGESGDEAARGRRAEHGRRLPAEQPGALPSNRWRVAVRGQRLRGTGREEQRPRSCPESRPSDQPPALPAEPGVPLAVPSRPGKASGAQSGSCERQRGKEGLTGAGLEMAGEEGAQLDPVAGGVGRQQHDARELLAMLTLGV